MTKDYMYCNDPRLEASMRRAFERVRKDVRENGRVKTRLYIFEKLQENNTEFEDRIRNICILVTIRETDDRYVLTQEFSFRHSVWTLYEEIETGDE